MSVQRTQLTMQPEQLMPTNPRTSLRNISHDDLPFLRQVYGSTRSEELAQVPWSDEQRAAFLDQQFNAQHNWYQQNYPGAQWSIVLRDNRPVGRLYLVRWPDQLRIIDIALLPSACNQGIGGALLGDIQALAQRLKLPVTIHVEQFNPAQRLYKRLGFKQIADKGVYWLMEWRGMMGRQGEGGTRDDDARYNNKC